MKIIPPSWKFEDRNLYGDSGGMDLLRDIERFGRTCYKSEDKITNESAMKFVKMLISKGHESVIEHGKVTVRVVCDRGVSHEIVRHRIASYSQESTRYCNYGHQGEITVILPPWYKQIWALKEETEKRGGGLYITDDPKLTDNTDSVRFWAWYTSCLKAEESYMLLINKGATPEEARAVLPNSLKTELVITFNLREWRHFFKLRTAMAAHPQMREITIPMLRGFKEKIPVVFDDIEEE